jgi:hypothetical protein
LRESILRAHPHDAVAFRLAHFVNFWLGRPQDMVASIERVAGRRAIPPERDVGRREAAERVRMATF